MPNLRQKGKALARRCPILFKPTCLGCGDLLQARPPQVATHLSRFTDEPNPMKNFLRALRCSWPYRGRLVISVGCALVAAMLWGLSLTAISPVLTIVTKKQNLQNWALEREEETQKRVATLKDKRKGPDKEMDALNQMARDANRDKQLRDLTREIAKLESELEAANRELYLYKIAEWYASRFLPADAFLTLVWVLIAVVISVIIRCFFEFWQE